VLTVAAGKSLVALAAAGLTGLAAVFLVPQETIITPIEMHPVEMPDGRVVSFATHEVTWASWKTCYDDGGCSFLPRPAQAGAKEDYPVTGINAFDAEEYVTWISQKTSVKYRLPTKDEWQTAAAELPQPKTMKLFTDPRLAWAADYASMPSVSPKVRPSGGFGKFGNGIADLDGNVWEWTQTCVVVTDNNHCPAYYVQGSHLAETSVFIRNPALGGCASGVPPSHLGLRIVKDS
jgi:formylglycine-generating enzyme required for sulfatase activity